MPGPISDSNPGRNDNSPYVPSWNYPKSKPKVCPCGHHEGYHNDKGDCLHSAQCGCKGLPSDCFTTDEEFLAPKEETAVDTVESVIVWLTHWGPKDGVECVRALKARVAELEGERDGLMVAEQEGVEIIADLKAEVERYRAALHRISSPTQSLDLLWWQKEARKALALTQQPNEGEKRDGKERRSQKKSC